MNSAPPHHDRRYGSKENPMPDVYKITPLETFAKEVIPAADGL